MPPDTPAADLDEDRVDLCAWEPRVWDILSALYERAGCRAQEAPTMLRGWL